MINTLPVKIAVLSVVCAGLAACPATAPTNDAASTQPDSTMVATNSSGSTDGKSAASSSRAESIEGDNAGRYQTTVERVFAEGLVLYDKGDYLGAIRRFRAPELASAWPELRLRVLKYLAFSECVTNNLAACEQAFQQALQVDSGFRLQHAEEGHPIWGPVWRKVKTARQ